ncbi:MAG: EAL domain-containing protein [Gammaproteobacteria bacterium]
MKQFMTPTMRITIGLVSLLISLVLAAELIGFLPDRESSALDARTKVVEALAVQTAYSASRNDNRSVQMTLQSAVSRNEDILSAAIRRVDGTMLAQAGDHQAHWKGLQDARSTPTQVQVPIFHNRKKWGQVELSFTPLEAFSGFEGFRKSVFGLLGFLAFVGFLVFFIYLRRALSELDPSGVIPDRVRSAFDALAEGVLIVDEADRIILANKSFGAMIDRPAETLAGQSASKLQWQAAKTGGRPEHYPWNDAIRDKKSKTGVPLMLDMPSGPMRHFMVNGAPILDGKGKPRGALATFDDVTDLQQKNEELQSSLQSLEKSKEEVAKQNQELQFLATRDPLTGCLNRRALFERFDRMFEHAQQGGEGLSCVMVDIDHFKNINDRYGHAAGDKVIQYVAESLDEICRDSDLLCRYGGEEFCMVFPGIDIDKAVSIADRLRLSIHDGFDARFTSSNGLTVSLGVAVFEPGIDTPAELINRADKALYSAKSTGRNRVIRWTEEARTLRTNILNVGDGELPDTDKSMLVERLDVSAIHQGEKVQRMREQVMQLDALIEQKSGEVHKTRGFDGPTSLPNRVLFYDRVEQMLSMAQRDANMVAILYLDIDLLQRDADVLGPVFGDELLHEATTRMLSVIRGTDAMSILGDIERTTSISRLAADEFGIALGGLEDVEHVTWVTQRLFDALSEPLEVDGNEIYMTCSVGISLYPNDGEDSETLIMRASTARHHAKTALGRNKFIFFADEMNARSYEQLRLEGQLRQAISRNELVLHYQPKVDMRRRRITGLEALVRWEHPDMGLIGPEWFIHIAEHTGFIADIGLWVLKTACAQMQKWQDDAPDCRMAVNLSAIQLRDPNLVEQIVTILDESGLSPESLELEVTETALMDNVDTAQRALEGLRERGIHISIDDFGTGYSSLSHLKKFVVDSLKIDRSFIADIASNQNDAALVAAIVAMAHRMSLRVVAEGVETETQARFLTKLQCDEAQGYLLSMPIPAEVMGTMLREDNIGKLLSNDVTESIDATASNLAAIR